MAKKMLGWQILIEAAEKVQALPELGSGKFWSCPQRVPRLTELTLQCKARLRDFLPHNFYENVIVALLLATARTNIGLFPEIGEFLFSQCEWICSSTNSDPFGIIKKHGSLTKLAGLEGWSTSPNKKLRRISITQSSPKACERVKEEVHVAFSAYRKWLNDHNYPRREEIVSLDGGDLQVLVEKVLAAGFLPLEFQGCYAAMNPKPSSEVAH